MTDVILTCSPYFVDLALNELRRFHPSLEVAQHIPPLYLFLKTHCTFDALTRPWRHRLPIYLYHLFPVQISLSLRGRAGDIDLLRRQAGRLCSRDVDVQARVVGDYPYCAVEIEQAIQPQQSRSAKPGGRVLSMLIADGCCHMGVSWATQNISPWAHGRLYIDEPVLNRAGLKLIEALDVFQIRLREHDHALDLGAAPGAWTEVLRRRGLRVTAVAPKEMYPMLQSDDAVRIFTMTAEEYLERCDTTYALLLNDMILDAQDSARLMAAYARHLRPEGIAIMTLKLRPPHARRVMDHALRLLRKQYKIIRVRQLVSNRKEVTLFLRKKAG